MSIESSQPLDARAARFEREHVEQRRIGGHITDVVDAKPEERSDELPILIAQGQGSGIHTNAAVMEYLFRRGYHVLAVNHPSAESDLVLTEDEREKSHSYPPIEVQKASNLLELLETSGLSHKKVDCFGFSEGALNSLIAAYLRPEQFRTMVLMAPAGLRTNDTIAKLMARFAHQVVKNEWDDFWHDGPPSHTPLVHDAGERARQNAYIAGAWKSESIRAAHGNTTRLQEELRALSTMTIDDLIQAVRAKGVKIILASGVDDRIVPTGPTAERFDTHELDGFLSIQGRHGPSEIVHALPELLKAAAVARPNTPEHFPPRS